jgi:hypothetical protein
MKIQGGGGMHVVAKHDKTIFIEKRRGMHGVKSGQERHPMMLPKMALFFPKLGQSPSTVNQQKKIVRLGMITDQ